MEGVRDVEQRCGGAELSESEFWRFGAEVWREQKCGRRNWRGAEVQNWSFGVSEWRCRGLESEFRSFRAEVQRCGGSRSVERNWRKAEVQNWSFGVLEQRCGGLEVWR